MIDPISVAIALGLLGTGWLIGRHAWLKAQPKPVLPICLCRDHYGTHDPKTGACTSSWYEEQFQSGKGTFPVLVRCACKRYTGPQPVEQYWVPPAADLTIVTAPKRLEKE